MFIESTKINLSFKKGRY